MQTKDIISRLGGKSLGQVIRFGIVGVAATAIQAVLYQVLVGWLRAELANAIAYVVSFIFNYVASTRFTFRVKSSARRGAGFLAFAPHQFHVANPYPVPQHQAGAHRALGHGAHVRHYRAG